MGGGAPTSDAHEVGFAAALGSPGVGEGVAKQVGPQAEDTQARGVAAAGASLPEPCTPVPASTHAARARPGRGG